VPAVQRIEHGDPVLAGDHRLAVQGDADQLASLTCELSTSSALADGSGVDTGPLTTKTWNVESATAQL
jgi:hypothetical protein